MPALIKILTRTGLLPAPYTANSLAEAATFEPLDGVYTVTNTSHTTQVLKLDAHLDRLEDSARRASIALTLDRPRLRQALRTMTQEANYGDVRFRVTVSRTQPDELILSVEPFTPVAPDVIENGVRTITAAHVARKNPAAKTTGWMHERHTLQDAMPPGIYDTFLLDDFGNILEGLASNFYAILNHELRTARAGVLAGIAQQIVLEIAPPIVAVRQIAAHSKQIPQFSEAFLTSSSRGIIPVVEIDGMTIGNGKPGALTRQLLDAYQAWVQTHLQEL
jgi:branched-chain amino acid aminotransferase